QAVKGGKLILQDEAIIPDEPVGERREVDGDRQRGDQKRRTPGDRALRGAWRVDPIHARGADAITRPRRMRAECMRGAVSQSNSPPSTPPVGARRGAPVPPGGRRSAIVSTKKAGKALGRADARHGPPTGAPYGLDEPIRMGHDTCGPYLDRP